MSAPIPEWTLSEWPLNSRYLPKTACCLLRLTGKLVMCEPLVVHCYDYDRIQLLQ